MTNILDMRGMSFRAMRNQEYIEFGKRFVVSFLLLLALCAYCVLDCIRSCTVDDYMLVFCFCRI